MVVSVSNSSSVHKSSRVHVKRPPLLPSTEANNNNNNEDEEEEETSRRKNKVITSRYLSTPSRSQSATMMLTRTPVKRAQSADRRRPGGTPKDATSAAGRQLVKSSRSLSVSFQGESFCMPAVVDDKAASVVSPVRKGRTERRIAVTPVPVRERDRRENLKPSDQCRWPGRLKSLNSSFMSQSLDCGGGGGGGSGRVMDKSNKFGSRNVVRSSMNSVLDIYDRARIEVNLKGRCDNDVKSGNALGEDSESSSVSSGSSSGGRPTVTQGGGGGCPRGRFVPARVWQETNNRIRRVEPEVVEKNGTKLKTVTPSKQVGNRKFLIDTPTASPRGVLSSRGLVSPLRGGVRPASPNKALMTPSGYSTVRGMTPSPTRTRNGVTAGSIPNNNSCGVPSMLNFAADARRGKVGENRVVDAHELRLLFNRHLQWRFVNARAEAALKAQTTTAERNLYNAWLTTLKLRHSVKSKRIQLQLLRQNMKLYSILKGQGPFLENWSIIDGDYCNSLSGAISALQASTIRLPVVQGARAEVQSVKDAISSAVDVMQAMGSSVSSLLSKVELVDSMAYELADVVANERAFLDQCNDQLSSVTALQVKECSLRTHLLQLKDMASCSTAQV